MSKLKIRSSLTFVISIYKVVALTVKMFVWLLITQKQLVRLREFKEFWNLRIEQRIPFLLETFFFFAFYRVGLFITRAKPPLS
jgi:uncharacterized membrane protein YdbT with pleckstrin-like domain